MDSTAEQTTEQTAQRAVKETKNITYIVDEEFNAIEIPIKVANGKVIYDVTKILKHCKRDEKAVKSASDMMDKIGKKIKNYFKMEHGEKYEDAFQRAVTEGFMEGKVLLSEMTEWNAAAADTDEDVADWNRRVMMLVFLYSINEEKLEQFVKDETVRRDLAMPDIKVKSIKDEEILDATERLYKKYPTARILEVTQNFLRDAGLR